MPLLENLVLDENEAMRAVGWPRELVGEREERIRGGDIGENRATSPPGTLHAEVNHHAQYHA